MSICDALSDWDSLSPEQRFDQVAEWAQQWAEEWGIDPPAVANENSPARESGVSSAAGYDPDTNTLYLGPDLFGDGASGADAVGEAAHEIRHAMQWDYFGEDKPYEMPMVPGEQDARDFGDAVRDYAEAGCDDEDFFDSAPGLDNLAGAGDWNLPAGAGAHA